MKLPGPGWAAPGGKRVWFAMKLPGPGLAAPCAWRSWDVIDLHSGPCEDRMAVMLSSSADSFLGLGGHEGHQTYPDLPVFACSCRE